MYYFLVNATGGSGKTKGIWEDVKKVLAERGAVPFQHPDDGILREMFRPVEGQMLQEVGQAPLPLLLIQGAGLDEQPIHGLALGIRIGKDIISKSVLQLPHTQGVPLGKRFLPRWESQRGKKQNKSQNTFQRNGDYSKLYITSALPATQVT